MNQFPDYPDDMGCEAATDFLGHQSHCLSCPWGKCLDDITSSEKRALKTFWNTGRLQPEYIYLANLAIYIVNHNRNRDKVKV